MTFFDPDFHPGDGYHSVPRHWSRDPRLRWSDKGILSYWASHERGYELSVAQIIAEGDDGKAAVYASIERLIKFEYLRRERITNKGRVVKVVYRWGPAAISQQYVRNWGAQEASATTGNAPEGDVSAGETTSRKSGSRKSGSRKSGSEKPATKKTNSKNTNRSNNPPPTPQGIPGAVESGQKAEEGEKDSQKPTIELDKAVDWLAEKFPQLVAKHPRFSRELLAEVLSAAVAQKLGSLRTATIVLRDIMAGKHGLITDKSSARRLIHPEFKGWAAVPPPPPSTDDQDKCDKPGHVGPKKGCIPCAAEAKTGGPGAEDAAAVEAFRNAAANGSKAQAWRHLSKTAQPETVAA